MDVGLSMALIDRLLGGKGSQPASVRALTKIECSIIQDVVQIILDEWIKMWNHQPALKLDLMGSESVPCFFNDPSASSPLVCMTLAVQFMDSQKNIDFLVPFPLFQIFSQHQPISKQATSAVPSTDAYPAFCEDMKLVATARWRPFSFQVADCLTLRKGDVIVLPKQMIHQTEFCFGGRVHFEGEIGIDHHQVVIQLNQPIYFQT